MAAGRRSASAGRRCTESGVQAGSSVAYQVGVPVMPVTCEAVWHRRSTLVIVGRHLTAQPRSQRPGDGPMIVVCDAMEAAHSGHSLIAAQPKAGRPGSRAAGGRHAERDAKHPLGRLSRLDNVRGGMSGTPILPTRIRTLGERRLTWSGRQGRGA